MLKKNRFTGSAKFILWIALIFQLAVMLSGCERPATISSWRPIETRAGIPHPDRCRYLEYLPPPLCRKSPPPLNRRCPRLLPCQLPSQRQMKGYELYSWQNGSNWNFTLITGTNRTKSFDEIIAPVIHSQVMVLSNSL